MWSVCSREVESARRVGERRDGRRSARLVVVVAIVVACVSAARAGVAPEMACKGIKAKAVGKLSLALLKAFGANEKKPNAGKLEQALSRARARYMKAVEAADNRAGCCGSVGDAETVGVLTDGFVAGVLAGLCPGSTTTIGSSTTTTTTTLPPAGPGLVIAEVMYDPASADDGLEWVELKNTGRTPVDLSGFSLGYGGADYTAGTLQLSGSVPSGGVFVVGGPGSDASNAQPVYDLVADLAPDLQNGGDVGDGVALFALPAEAITSTSVPVDAVVYGPNNDGGLIDARGTAGPPDVADAPAGSSIERSTAAGAWQVQSAPTPNTTPF